MKLEKDMWRARGPRVYYPNNAGGFDLSGAPDPDETARRIVACLNACTGISTDALETVGTDLLDGNTQPLIQQRDELLAALKAACPPDIEEACDECAPGPCVGCWVTDARAVIAKVGETTTGGTVEIKPTMVDHDPYAAPAGPYIIKEKRNGIE